MERLVVFACRHRFPVPLPHAITEKDADELAVFLSRMRCMYCQQSQRYHNALHLQQRLDLFPLTASDPCHRAMAEQVRAEIVRSCLPEQESPGFAVSLAALRLLVHARLDADFWIERRAVLWDPQRVPLVLADLQCEATLLACGHLALCEACVLSLSCVWLD
jgi:hypothetical protein